MLPSLTQTSVIGECDSSLDFSFVDALSSISVAFVKARVLYICKLISTFSIAAGSSKFLFQLSIRIETGFWLRYPLTCIVSAASMPAIACKDIQIGSKAFVLGGSTGSSSLASLLVLSVEG